MARQRPVLRDDMVGLDCSIIMHPRVWEASGHVGGFSDPMVDCRSTKERFRADQMTAPVVRPDRSWAARPASRAPASARLRRGRGREGDVERENAKAIEKFKKAERRPRRGRASST